IRFVKSAFKSVTPFFKTRQAKAYRTWHNPSMRWPKRVLLLLLLATSCPIQAQTASESQQRICTAVESDDWTAARAEVETLRTNDPGLFERNGYNYLLGRIAE